MGRKQTSIYARTIENQEALKQQLKPQDFFDDQLVEKKKTADRYRPIQEFQSRAEEIAKSTIYYRNYYYTKEHFKHDESLRRVDKYFPHASGGPLYVDEPSGPSDFNRTKIKESLMKEIKFRYLIIEENDTLFDLLQKLGEIK